jgi:glycosyltransferase involved in cell wall biosynthesis
VLIEAAASGLPLVAVNAGAVREICVNNENGFLIEINKKSKSMISDVKSMISDAVSMILKDEKMRERFSVNSVKLASEHDFEKTLDKFINIYQRVLNNKVR